jgi:hypothetical protein
MLEEKKHPIQRVLVPLSLSVIVLIRLYRSAVADPDLWGYMTFGRLFWESKTFPYQDIFTYLPTHDRWIYHEWLTGVVLYPIYKFAGGLGLVVLRDLVAVATLGFLYLAARIRKSSSVSALFLLFFVSKLLIVGYATVLRAQIFTYLFTAVTLYLLERSRQKRQWFLLLILVLIQIVWCNLHGGFLMGLGIIAIYTVGEALSRRTWWPYVSVFLLSVLSTLINPYGVDYWTYLFHAVTLPRNEITEWASIFTAYVRHDISLNQIIWYAAMGALPLMILVWARWREITPILLLSVTFLLGIQHVRHQVFFPMLVAVYLPEPFQRYIEHLPKQLANVRIWLKEKAPVSFVGSRRMAAFFMAILIFLFCFFLVSSSFSLMIPSKENGEILYYPTGALEYIKRNYSSGNILTEFVWGEYLIWNLGPHMKVGLDGRYETVYQDHVANEYFDYIQGKKNGFLDSYAHDLVLFRPDSRPALSLRQSPDWKVAYEDMDSILFTKVQR